jgi:hypothetical protein
LLAPVCIDGSRFLGEFQTQSGMRAARDKNLLQRLNIFKTYAIASETLAVI